MTAYCFACINHLANRFMTDGRLTGGLLGTAIEG
jgi:hypothetical protein